MFFRSKKENQPEEINPPETPRGYSDVYVMPEKYIVEMKKGSKGLLIATIILIAVILLTVSYLVYDMVSRRPATVAPPVIPPQLEIPVAEPPPEPKIPAITEPEIVTTTEEAVATTTPPLTPAVILPSLDSDNDGLSDIEETVLGTLPSNPDTDGDGYKDGVEVAAGYSPTKPGSAKLNESPFIVSLSTSFDSDNFQLLYPKDWRVSFIKASQQAMITAPTGEIIRISVKNNQLGQSVLTWYLQDHPEVLVSQLRIVEAGALSGLYAPNSLTAYLTDAAKTKFYFFEYLISQQAELRYQTIFGAIIKSLTLVAAPVAPVASSTVACLGYLCAEEPCGPLPSGQNSCLSPTLKSTCYEKSCTANSDCPTGQICAEISCWVGQEAGEIAKVCK